MRDILKSVRSNAIVTVVAMLILCLGNFNQSAAGQQKEARIKAQLVGTWTVVRMRNDKGVDVMGPNPMGMLVFDAAVNYSTQVMRSDLPKFAISDRTKATPEESQAVVRGFMALYGKYTVSDSNTITLHVIGSMLPNWDGADQKRSFVLKDDELELTNLTNSSGEAVVHTFWKRISVTK